MKMSMRMEMKMKMPLEAIEAEQLSKEDNFGIELNKRALQVSHKKQKLN